MFKKKVLLFSLLFSVLTSLTFAKTSVSIVDYEGKDAGLTIPKWVKEAVSGLKLTFKEDSNLNYYVTLERGPDLGLLKKKAKISFKSELSSIITKSFPSSAYSVSIEYAPEYNFTTMSSSIKFDELYFIEKSDYSTLNGTGVPGRISYTMSSPLPLDICEYNSFWLKYEITDDETKEVLDTYYDYILVHTVKKAYLNSLMEKALASSNNQESNSRLEIIPNFNNSEYKKEQLNIDGSDLISIALDRYGDIEYKEWSTGIDDDVYIAVSACRRGTDLRDLQKDTYNKDIKPMLKPYLDESEIDSITSLGYDMWIDVIVDGKPKAIDYYAVYLIEKELFEKYSNGKQIIYDSDYVYRKLN